MEHTGTVISFSVFGNDLKYTIGMLRNIELSDKIYPGWNIFVYHDNTVPKEMIDEYNKFPYVSTIDMTDSTYPGMFWRFLPDVDVLISRDADSRLSLREKYAVDEWLFSGKKFHIMRDHPAHNSITVPGGMWGINTITPGPNIIMKKTIEGWLSQNKNTDEYGKDQVFLRGIYDYYYSQKNIMIHDSIGTYGDDSVPFPTKHGPDYHFVGEVFDENEKYREDHHKDWLNNKNKERLPL